MKILHVVENLGRGAVENWLIRMLVHARKRNSEINWTFYSALGQPGVLDEKARALGARVVHSPVPIGRKVAFICALRQELRQGSYDVLHCHHDIVSAIYLVASSGLPIGRRIVHVHNADESMLTPSKVKQAIFQEPMRRICLRMADRIIGISNHTLDTFLSGRSRRPERDLVHYYGLEPKVIPDTAADRDRFRRELNLPEDALILLFSGRLVPEKGPTFAIDVLSELRRMEPRSFGVFAGCGSEEQWVLARAKELGVEAAIRMLGWRGDLPSVMGCCDWFILPHPERPMEGFGLAVVEAQLAGLRMLLSTGIPDDPLLSTAIYRRLPMSVAPSTWASAAIELLEKPTPSRSAAVDALQASPMNMDRALNELLSFYA